METLLTVTRKIRKCKTCGHTCEEEYPIVGCESVMVPIRPFTSPSGKTYVAWCDKRIWFNERYEPVKVWPTEEQIKEYERLEKLST